MKKLLLAPFLLASVFSFRGELKAYPTRMDSGFEPTSKIPAQVRDDTKWLSVVAINLGYDGAPFFTMPYKNQQACIRNSELLVSAYKSKTSNVINMYYECVKVNR